jgi:PKD repeat protein
MKTKLFLLLSMVLISAGLSAQACTSFVAKFSLADSANTIKFYDSSSVNPSATGVNYYISWGDGTFYNGPTKPNFQTHSYTNYGAYNICFYVSGYVNTVFCKDSLCKTVTFCAPYTPTISGTTNSKCSNPCSGGINFSGLKPNSVHYIRSWYYNNTFQQFTSMYQFTTNANGVGVINGLCPGVYQGIKISTSMVQGCVYIVNGVASIGVTSNLNGSLTIQHINGTTPGKMKVIPTGGVLPYTYQWNSQGANIDSFVTTTPGYYCVTVTDSVGCKKTLCGSILNTGLACTGNPIVPLLQGPDSICSGTSFTFQIYMGSQSGLSYQWQASFDTINWTNIGTNAPSLLVAGPTAGCSYYRVKVSCTNSGQFTYSNFKRVCAKSCSAPAIKPCDTLHNVGHNKNCNQVTFEARNAPAGYSMTYSWYFSNNTTGQGRVITKTFMNGGYFAKLYYCVYNQNQQVVCCDSSMVTFSVNCGTTNPCTNVKAKFGYNATGANVLFADSSTFPSGMALTYHWLFGDGNTSSMKNPTHTYANAGTYTVRLAITGWFNNSTIACKDTVYKIVVIGTGNPCARLTPNFTFTQSANSFNFINTSVYNGLGKVGVLWVFGDGTSSTLNNPTKVYATPGAKNVTLNVTAFDTPTGTTCVKAINMWVQPGSSPCAGFDARFTYTKNFLNLNFTNTSVGVGTGTTYLWNFGNGATSTQPNPSYTFPLPGMYRVVLKVTTTFSNNTCVDSAVYYINVNTSNPCKDSGYVSLMNYQCGTYISPICGCDGVTYKNYCDAAKAGVKQYTQGPCANDTTYVKICGYVYNDRNYNCAKDSLDHGVNGMQVKLAGMGGNYITYTNNVGYYQFYAPKGTYQVTQILSQSNFYYNSLNLRQMCPANNASIPVNAPVAGNVYCNNNFFDTLKNCLDLSVSLTKFRNITPGFQRTVYVNYKNRSPFAVANVKVKYRKNAIQTFVSSIPSASAASGNIYTWNIGALAPNQSGVISIKLFTPVSVALGTMAYDTAWIEPDTNDCELANNRATLKDSCRGSWDPNDKAVSPQGEGEKGNITKDVRTLDYLVRFQNTGTAPAFNVKVEDMLDTDLDWSTFKIHAVSHPYEVFMEDNGKLIFEFKDIMLPDSATDFEASQGFINYSIDMKDNLAIGTELQNTAAIYFDFNEPIITNTTLNTIVEKTTGIIELVKGQLEVKLSPNPMRDMANFIIKATATDKLSINITDISGKLVRQVDLDVKEGNHVTSLNVSDLNNGMYIIQVQSANHQMQSIKVIKE